MAVVSLKPTFLNYWQMFSEAGARHCQDEQSARRARGLAVG